MPYKVLVTTPFFLGSAGKSSEMHKKKKRTKVHRPPSVHQKSNPDLCEVTKSSHSVIGTDPYGTRYLSCRSPTLHSCTVHLLACDNGMI